jgi:hypothetical protein
MKIRLSLFALLLSGGAFSQIMSPAEQCGG